MCIFAFVYLCDCPQQSMSAQTISIQDLKSCPILEQFVSFIGIIGKIIELKQGQFCQTNYVCVEHSPFKSTLSFYSYFTRCWSEYLSSKTMNKYVEFIHSPETFWILILELTFNMIESLKTFTSIFNNSTLQRSKILIRCSLQHKHIQDLL